MGSEFAGSSLYILHVMYKVMKSYHFNGITRNIYFKISITVEPITYKVIFPYV